MTTPLSFEQKVFNREDRAGRLAQPDALQHESLWLTTHRPTDIDEWVAARPA